VLSWKAVEGAAGYQVYRSTTGEDGNFTRVKTTTDLSFTNSKAELGATYYYKVRAITEDGTKGVFSKIIKVVATQPA
jgi:fibronectin type 3 domain-containing protein